MKFFTVLLEMFTAPFNLLIKANYKNENKKVNSLFVLAISIIVVLSLIFAFYYKEILNV